MSIHRVETLEKCYIAGDNLYIVELHNASVMVDVDSGKYIGLVIESNIVECTINLDKIKFLNDNIEYILNKLNCVGDEVRILTDKLKHTEKYHKSLAKELDLLTIQLDKELLWK